jgi:drug/metabolite transporter (DMT)-like permease
MNSQHDNTEHMALGMAAAVGAMLMFAVMNAFAKYLSAGHSVIEIAFYRNLVGCLPFLLFAFAFNRRDILIIRNKPALVATRALLGSVSLIVTFGAFSLMPMAETSVLLFTASLWIPVLGVLLLKERVGPFRWSAVLIGFVGVAVMLDPAGAISKLGVTFALSAAFLQALMSILLRHLGGHERPETISFYFFLIGLVVTALAMPFVAKPLQLAELPLLVGVGIAGAAAQWLYSVALKNTPAAVVAVVNYTAIVWSLLLGWMIWRDWPLPIVLAGAAVIIAANLLIVWRESRLARRPPRPSA